MGNRILEITITKYKTNCKQLMSNRTCNLIKVGIGCKGCEEYEVFLIEIGEPTKVVVGIVMEPNFI